MGLLFKACRGCFRWGGYLPSDLNFPSSNSCRRTCFCTVQRDTVRFPPNPTHRHHASAPAPARENNSRFPATPTLVLRIHAGAPAHAVETIRVYLQIQHILIPANQLLCEIQCAFRYNARSPQTQLISIMLAHQLQHEKTIRV